MRFNRRNWSCRVCIIALPLFSIFGGCKKFESNQPSQSSIDFFKADERVNPTVLRIIENLKIHEQRKPFVEQLKRHHGIPIWSHAQVQINNSNHNNVTGNTDTLVSIPIVHPGENYVRSVLAVKVNSEIWYKLLDGIKYDELPLDEVPGENTFTSLDLIKLLMILEKQLFNHDKFVLRRMEEPFIPYYSSTLSFSNGCAVFTFGYQSSSTNFIVLDTDIECLYQAGELVYSLELPDLFGGGGAGGGGGSSSTNQEECNRGFIAITGFDGNGTPLIPCPDLNPVPDSIPNRLSRISDRLFDSLYNWGQVNNFREQGFIIVSKNDSLYCKNFRPGTRSGDQTKINYQLSNGEALVAYCHTHSEDTINAWRSCFSPEDLMEFNKNAFNVGYTAMLEVGNARYALVLEDKAKKDVFNISRRGNHRNLYQEVLESLASQYPDVQIRTEKAWVEYLQSASISGIGFYKATAPDKNNFVKLN
jgi:hypothetical protein